MDTINVAIISNGVVIDVAVFKADDFSTAQEFLKQGVWDACNADEVQILPEGFNIGDKFDGENWTMQNPPREGVPMLPPKVPPISHQVAELNHLMDTILGVNENDQNLSSTAG